jgi:hypothetical protein
MQKPLHGLQNDGDVRSDGIQWAGDDHLKYPNYYRDEKAKSGAIKNKLTNAVCCS